MEANSNNNNKIGSAAKDDETPPDAAVMREGPQDEEYPGECWDIIKVLDPAKEPGVLCRIDDCQNPAVAVWQSITQHDEQQDYEVWPLCAQCQEIHFLGESRDDMVAPPAAAQTDRYVKDSRQDDGGGGGDAWVLVNGDTQPGDLSSKTSSSETALAPGDAPMSVADAYKEDCWELQKIFTKDEITEAKILCEEEGCTLLAAVVWANTRNPDENWRACLDCQDTHFGGWPEPEDIPVQNITQEHKDFLVDKCSRCLTVSMPDFSADHPSQPADTTTNPAAGPAYSTERTRGSSRVPGIQQQQKELYTQWQAAAVEMGGPDARIVLDTAVAKEMIRHFLGEQISRPATILQIYKGLKAVIPSPILHMVIQEMVLEKDGPVLKFSL